MADEWQLKKLLSDTDAWNEWRQKEPQVKIDLSDSSLKKAYLIGADLQDADLSNSDLSNADLTHTDLSGSNLVGANLDMADLSNSIIYGADLSHAKFTSVSIRGADISDVTFYKTALANTDLSEANLSHISFDEKSAITVFEKKNEQTKEPSGVANAHYANRALVLSAATALASVDEFTEKLRTNNILSVEFPDHKESLLEYLNRLRDGLENLIAVVDVDSSANYLDENQDIDSGYWYHLIKELERYLSAESRAKITVPAVLTFSCGSLGALLGGPLGFGAGSMTAAYLLGQTNSKAVADKIEKTISSED